MNTAMTSVDFLTNLTLPEHLWGGLEQNYDYINVQLTNLEILCDESWQHGAE